MTDTPPSLCLAFWSAARGTAPLPLATEPGQSGGCGCSAPAAEENKEETPATAEAASSCCGPKPAAGTAASA